MPRAVVVAEAVDGLREDLDAPRGRRQRMGLGIAAELGEEHAPVVGDRQLDVAGPPEGVEVRQLDALARDLLAEQVIEVAQPVHLAAALGERRAEPETRGESGEDVVVVARLADRRQRLVHGENLGVVAGAADVVALQRRFARVPLLGRSRVFSPNSPIQAIRSLGFSRRSWSEFR